MKSVNFDPLAIAASGLNKSQFKSPTWTSKRLAMSDNGFTYDPDYKVKFPESCSAIIRRGDRRGLVCANKVRKGHEWCMAHNLQMARAQFAQQTPAPVETVNSSLGLDRLAEMKENMNTNFMCVPGGPIVGGPNATELKDEKTEQLEELLKLQGLTLDDVRNAHVARTQLADKSVAKLCDCLSECVDSCECACHD